MTIGNLYRWPSKFVDYLAASKPVVATPVSDFPQIFLHNIGVLSKNDSIHEFSRALLEMLHLSENWIEMGENSKKYALKHLSWDLLVDKLIELYKHSMK